MITRVLKQSPTNIFNVHIIMDKCTDTHTHTHTHTHSFNCPDTYTYMQTHIHIYVHVHLELVMSMWYKYIRALQKEEHLTEVHGRVSHPIDSIDMDNWLDV